MVDEIPMEMECTQSVDVQKKEMNTNVQRSRFREPMIYYYYYRIPFHIHEVPDDDWW